MNPRRAALPAASPPITRVAFTSAAIAQLGLLGFVRFRVAGMFVVNSVAVRRTREGRIVLSFPASRSRRGRARNILHPIDQLARDEIERVVLAAVREQAPWLFQSVSELSP